MSKKIFGIPLFLAFFFYFALFTECKESKMNVVHIISVPAEGGKTNQPPILYHQNGKSLSITAVPEAGYKFYEWRIDGAIVEGHKSSALNLKRFYGDQYIEAIFVPIHIIPAPENSGLVLKYNTNSNTKGFNMTFLNNFETDKNPCDATSIFIDEEGSDTFVPTGVLVQAPSKETINKNQYSCSLSADKRIISLGEHFRPIAKKFTIKIFDAVFNVRVESEIPEDAKLTLSSSLQFIPESFNGCGQSGTIVQRVFDCSMLITNFHINRRTLVPSPNIQDFYPEDWFVVECAAGGQNVSIEKCAWLTPVIHNINNAFVNFGLTVKDFEKAYLSTARVLFSPILTKPNMYENEESYTLEEALGSNLWKDLIAPPSTNLSFCRGSCFIGRYLPPTRWQEPDNSTPKENSVCVTASSSEILFNTSLLWRLPSYPIFALLASNLQTNSQDSFNGGQIPGFVNKTSPKNLWSSSYMRVGEENVLRPIYFNSRLGITESQAFPNVNELKSFLTKNSVRCVNTSWN